MPIVGIPSGLSGTTNYTYTSILGISANLFAGPPAPNGASFSSWSGCDSLNNYIDGVAYGCIVAVNSGAIKTVTANYTTPGYPNMVILSPITITPASHTVGSTVNFTATVKNTGNVPAGNTSVTRLQIDYDNNGGGSSWDETILPDQNTSNLIANSTEKETWSWIALRAGTHVVRICADATNTVNESTNEGDNCSPSALSSLFTVGGGPPEPRAIVNVQSSGASGVAIARISGPSDIGGTTNYSKSYLNNFSTVIQAPPTAPNKAAFLGWTGCSSAVSQNCSVSANIGDNKTVVANYSAPRGTKPNLEVAGVMSISPSSPSSGQSVTFSATIRNSGDGGAPYTLISNLFIDEGNDGNTNYWEYTLSRNTGALEPGEIKLEEWNNAWIAKTGTHRIRICPDIPNLIEETNENDNCATDVILTVSAGTFDYSLSDSSTVTIDKSSGVGQKVISKTFISGIGQSVNISLSGVPSGVSYSISGNPCTPTCSSNITFTVLPTAVNGTYPITVTGSPLSKQVVFNLTITGSAMSITCVPSPAVALIGQPVTWTATVTGGAPGAMKYAWNGSGIPTNPAPKINPYTLTYSTIGVKTANVTVTDAASSTAQCIGASTAQINFDPQFEEF